MEGIESHLLAIILHTTTMMRQPLTPMQALEEANSLLHGSAKQEENKEWNKKHLPKNLQNGELGRKYWLNFYKRHKDVLFAKTAVQFENK